MLAAVVGSPGGSACVLARAGTAASSGWPGASPGEGPARPLRTLGRHLPSPVEPPWWGAVGRPSLSPDSLHGDPELHGVCGLGRAGPHQLDEEVGAEDAELGVPQLVQGVPVGRGSRPRQTPGARGSQGHLPRLPTAPGSPRGLPGVGSQRPSPQPRGRSLNDRKQATASIPSTPPPPQTGWARGSATSLLKGTVPLAMAPHGPLRPGRGPAHQAPSAQPQGIDKTAPRHCRSPSVSGTGGRGPPPHPPSGTAPAPPGQE